MIQVYEQLDNTSQGNVTIKFSTANLPINQLFILYLLIN